MRYWLMNTELPEPIRRKARHCWVSEHGPYCDRRQGDSPGVKPGVNSSGFEYIATLGAAAAMFRSIFRNGRLRMLADNLARGRQLS